MADVLSGLNLASVALAAVGAGVVNAIAGGGTLISFPALTGVGVPAVAANVTNTVALTPGYLGATLAQWKDLSDQGTRLRRLMAAGVVGGFIGALLLVSTPEKLFRELVPYLILLASALLAVQDRVRQWVTARRDGAGGAAEGWVAAPVLAAAIYGGYFGAGLSVIILAVLGLALDDTLTRLNGLKQAIAFATNVTAALFFLFSGQVVWSAAAVMAVGALLGGVLGGRLAGRIRPKTLRLVVVTIGVIVALIYLLR